MLVCTITPVTAWGWRPEGAPVPSVMTPSQGVISGPYAITPSPWSGSQDFSAWLSLSSEIWPK